MFYHCHHHYHHYHHHHHPVCPLTGRRIFLLSYSILLSLLLRLNPPLFRPLSRNPSISFSVFYPFPVIPWPIQSCHPHSVFSHAHTISQYNNKFLQSIPRSLVFAPFHLISCKLSTSNFLLTIISTHSIPLPVKVDTFRVAARRCVSFVLNHIVLPLIFAF